MRPHTLRRPSSELPVPHVKNRLRIVFAGTPEFALPLLLAAVGLTALAWDRRYRSTRLFVLLLVAFALLTVTGVWFRGSGMALVWPWNV